MTFGLPSLPEALDRWRLRNVCPKDWQTLVGRDSQGQWKTTQAKAYPSALNGCIIECFIQRIVQLEAVVGQTDQPEIQVFLPVIQSIAESRNTSGQNMGMDYAG